MDKQKTLTEIGLDILNAARNELYLNLPYLDTALCGLAFRPGDGVTVTLAADGESLYYDGGYLSDRYLRSRTGMNRIYLHVILHCMLRHLAKKQGKIRFIGITNHRLAVAQEAIDSGLYDTLQFPFSYLSSEQELNLVEQCKEKDMGFLAMKALAGGLINHSEMAYAYMNQYDNVLPIWGIQRERELDEFLSYQDNPPKMEGEIAERIARDKQELQGEFCRGCGYCMPCPAGIEINNCARMSLLLRRAPSAAYLGEETQEKMKKIEGCLECGQCKSKCPYGLNTPELLKKNYKDYQEVLAGKAI